MHNGASGSLMIPSAEMRTTSGVDAAPEPPESGNLAGNGPIVEESYRLKPVPVDIVDEDITEQLEKVLRGVESGSRSQHVKMEDEGKNEGRGEDLAQGQDKD